MSGSAIPAGQPEPLCMLCVGGAVYIKDGCPRCAETGIDRDPLAPVVEGFAVAAGAR